MFLDVTIRSVMYCTWHQGSLLSLPSFPGKKGKARRRKECSYVTKTGFHFGASVIIPPFV